VTDISAAESAPSGDGILDGGGLGGSFRRDASAALLAVSADPVTTYLAVRGGAAEGHPLWAAAIGHLGAGPAMMIRLLVGLILVGLVMLVIQHDGAPVTRWCLRALTGVFAAVAAWNLGVLLTI
jgi:hypothetical protein